MTAEENALNSVSLALFKEGTDLVSHLEQLVYL